MTSRPATIVAALGGGANGAPFDRAQVVLAMDDGRLVQADRWEGARPVGPELSPEDLDALVTSGEAVRLPRPVAAEPGLFAWTLGPGFGPRRSWLVARLDEGRGIAERVAVGGATVLLVREGAVGFVRDELAEEARRGARAALSRGATSAALADAELAWLAARAVTPELVALVVEAQRRSGRADEAEATRRLEANSQGWAFDQHVDKELAKLEAPAADRVPWRSRAQAAILGGLDALGAPAAA